MNVKLKQYDSGIDAGFSPQEVLAICIQCARERDYKSGWIAHTYRAIYEEWPIKLWKSDSFEGQHPEIYDPYSRFLTHDSNAVAVNDYSTNGCDEIYVYDKDEIENRLNNKTKSSFYWWGALIVIALLISMCVAS